MIVLIIYKESMTIIIYLLYVLLFSTIINDLLLYEAGPVIIFLQSVKLFRAVPTSRAPSSAAGSLLSVILGRQAKDTPRAGRAAARDRGEMYKNLKL